MPHVAHVAASRHVRQDKQESQDQQGSTITEKFIVIYTNRARDLMNGSINVDIFKSVNKLDFNII